jgi:hypothetical protein
VKKVNDNEFDSWEETVFSLYTFLDVVKNVAKSERVNHKILPLDVSQLPDRYRLIIVFSDFKNRNIEEQNNCLLTRLLKSSFLFSGSAGDPDPVPDPQDPHDVGQPGYGSICQGYGSRSRSFSFLINVLSGRKLS